jgi:hypothetical protein
VSPYAERDAGERGVRLALQVGGKMVRPMIQANHVRGGTDDDIASDDGPAFIISIDQARQGEVSGHMLRLLVLSLMLALVAAAVFIAVGM